MALAWLGSGAAAGGQELTKIARRSQETPGRGKHRRIDQTTLDDALDIALPGTPTVRSSSPTRGAQDHSKSASRSTAAPSQRQGGGGRPKKGANKIAQITTGEAATLAMGLLAVFHRLRVVESAVLVVITCSSTRSIIQRIVAEGGSYHSATKGKKGHKMGAPHTWLFSAGIASEARRKRLRKLPSQLRQIPKWLPRPHQGIPVQKWRLL